MKHRTLVEQHMRACRHFNGIMHKTCRKGMVYDEMDKDCRVTYRAGLPCHKHDEEELAVLEKAGVEPATCPHADFPTLEEAQAHEKDVHDHFHRTLRARDAIVEHEQGKRGVAGEIDCPLCGTGRLRYSIAECNGHIHAACTTKDCVSWME